MTLIEEISNWISSRTTIPIEYVKLAVTTIVILLIASIVKKLLELLYRQFVKDPKKAIYLQSKEKSNHYDYCNCYLSINLE